MRGRSNGQHPPPQPRRELPPHIEEGEELLHRQLTPHASGFRHKQGFGPEPVGRFGGGTSPIRTGYTIREDDVGKVVEWDGDGFVRIARKDYLSEPPDDGRLYARRHGEWVAIGEEPPPPPPPPRGLRWDTDVRWDDGTSHWDQTGGPSWDENLTWDSGDHHWDEEDNG